jgi:SecD/SecF fusion protein
MFRFTKWQYGAGAVLGLAHNTIIVLGAFSLLSGLLPFSLEIDQAFIAAILTVVGYTINDTVVVFDRIREYHRLYPKRNDMETTNAALNSTLRRTFSTSLSTLVVLIAIFIFGGTSIKGFVFALLIGIIVGTYSSICIATPISFDLRAKFDKSKKVVKK